MTVELWNRWEDDLGDNRRLIALGVQTCAAAPVQYEGFLWADRGYWWYFRGRHEHWSFEVYNGPDQFWIAKHEPVWEVTESYGSQQFDASYMAVKAAETLIERSIVAFRTLRAEGTP